MHTFFTQVILIVSDKAFTEWFIFYEIVPKVRDMETEQEIKQKKHNVTKVETKSNFHLLKESYGIVRYVKVGWFENFNDLSLVYAKL